MSTKGCIRFKNKDIVIYSYISNDADPKTVLPEIVEYYQIFSEQGSKELVFDLYSNDRLSDPVYWSSDHLQYRYSVDLDKGILTINDKLKTSLTDQTIDSISIKNQWIYVSDLLKSDFPLKVKFKDRKPDPGICKVLSIDWENKKLSVSNGAVRLYPDFDQVVVVC